jgi:hypothetical protein
MVSLVSRWPLVKLSTEQVFWCDSVKRTCCVFFTDFSISLVVVPQFLIGLHLYNSVTLENILFSSSSLSRIAYCYYRRFGDDSYICNKNFDAHLCMGLGMGLKNCFFFIVS